jgi:hypothetical protein|tara:strand:+ start:2388 stop:2960 length:573 start_codon:yes stop_codon:yes gene_type:complete
MDKLGKLTFRFATNNDKPLVEDFCKLQKDNNNTSLEKMKWDWCLKNGTWTVAIYEDKIVSIAGIHDLPEVGFNCYRCLFRGAQLPGYTLGTGRDIFKTGIHLTHLLNLQIDWAPKSADLFISTNINDDGGKSQRMNNTIMPLLAKRGIWTLDKEMELYNVPQNLWRINVERYKEERNRSLNSDKNTDQKS